MKSNSKFFLGLTCGLVISFFIFNSNAILHAKGAKPESAKGGDVSITGSAVTAESMMPLINSYKNEIVPKIGGNASTGGFIKRSVLNNITGSFDGEYIKYSFYHAGNGKIGLFFQKQSNQSQGIRTGNAAFCPTLCEFPK